MKFSKCTAPFHITYELGQIKEIRLGMHRGPIRIEKFHTKTVLILSGTIRIEKFHTKTASILSFLMFEKCQFRENYPITILHSITLHFSY